MSTVELAAAPPASAPVARSISDQAHPRSPDPADAASSSRSPNILVVMVQALSSTADALFVVAARAGSAWPASRWCFPSGC